jgi:hypothetical protein
VSKHAVFGTVAALCVVALAANAAQASAPLTLEQRVLRPNEFSGFTPMGQHPVIRSASTWSGGNLPTADLRQHGFVAGVREKLHSRALNADALSVAVAVPVGAFADPAFPAPTRSVWESRRHPWLEPPEDVEHESE